MMDGIIAVDKPAGISSARVTARLKRRPAIRKIGHTGTLDPFATGVMLCGINRGTRISRFLLGGDKHYEAVIRLGVTTDTLDGTGRETHRTDDAAVMKISPDDLNLAVSRFLGRQMQTPPVYSALKHQGVPLYRLARQGRPVEKPPREIHIHRMDICDISLPCITIQVACSAGTYIRSLARDIGDSLGCGGHLSALCRTRSCGISLDRCLPLSDLEEMDDAAFDRRIISMADALGHLPAMAADGEMLNRVRFGRPLDPAVELPEGAGWDQPVRILDQAGRLVAVVTRSGPDSPYKYCCVFMD